MPTSKEDFLARGRTLRREPLQIPGFEGYFVREVTAKESRETAERAKAPDTDDLEEAARLAVYVVCDEAGAPVLDEKDLPAVKEFGMRVLSAIGDQAGRLSGWGGSASADAKKNGTGTSPTPEPPSPTSSAAPSETAGGDTPTR